MRKNRMELVETNSTLPASPEEIRSHLESGRARLLSKDRFPYHNWEQHVLTAYEDAEKLGKMKGLSPRKIDLLKIAALYHDIGLPEGKTDHEERSAKIASVDLDKLGFSKEDISIIKRIILGTQGHMEDYIYVTEPSEDELVLIMRDADISNLGKENFIQTSEGLRNEWGAGNKKDWIKFQIEFVKKHKFHTKEAEKLWQNQKNKNLQLLQQKLAEF